MTGPEHYAKAEAWLYKAKHGDARGDAETVESCAAIARVHAALATAAAFVDTVAVMRPEERDEWDRVTGRLEDAEATR